MKTDYKHYPAFAEIFRYPSEDFSAKVIDCQQIIEKQYPELSDLFKPFADYMLSKDLYEQQELYTKTFDVQPICYLDLGYIIFGEDYKRGAFLLHMQQEQQNYNNDCGFDLSDNICNILTLIPMHKDATFVNDLATSIMIPGLKKMTDEFASARVDLKVKVLKKLHKAIIQEDLNQGNVYRNAIETLKQIFELDFSEALAIAKSAEQDLSLLSNHQSFFSKNSISREVNELINNYNID